MDGDRSNITTFVGISSSQGPLKNNLFIIIKKKKIDSFIYNLYFTVHYIIQECNIIRNVLKLFAFKRENYHISVNHINNSIKWEILIIIKEEIFMNYDNTTSL